MTCFALHSRLIVSRYICHSTETALLKNINGNDILRALDGDVFVLTLLDLSSAFSIVDHILFHRLQSLYSISRTVVSRFES